MADTGLSRRGSYPLQSNEFTAAATEKPIPWDDKSDRLPSTLRAVKDSSKADENGRSLIVCLDGTGDQFDHDNSNVVQLVSCLMKHDPRRQVVYYQPGIGTSDEGGVKNYIKASFDMAVGSSLGTHVKDAYKFLMRNYQEGDKICLLGFSRGAYTVRCLVGMLHKIGLLPANNFAQVGFAYNFYKDDSSDGWDMSRQFKRTFCTDVSVYFVGLWDCVASVGFIPRKLPFSKSPTNSISFFRHAMSLDEHRAKFTICQWQQEAGLEDSGDSNDKEKQELAESKQDVNRNDSHVVKSKEGHRRGFVKPPTDVLEVWFMGAHADVGGGAVSNETRHMLSRIPLRWMIRQCFECDTGILFDSKRLAEFGLDVHTLWPTHRTSPRLPVGPPPTLLEAYHSKSLPKLEHLSATFSFDMDNQYKVHEHHSNSEPLQSAGNAHRPRHLDLMSESTEDYFDARSPINDQLVVKKLWWILEAWPVKVLTLMRDGKTWEKRVGMNMGKRRACRQPQPKIHWTVQDMIDDKKYSIRARVDKTTTWQVAA